MSKLHSMLAAAALALGTAAAQAAPVQFTYTSTVTSSAISGVSVGDAVTIQLLADNGANSLASQTWTIGDLISGSLSAGSYSQSYVDGWFSSPSWVAFQTNAAGVLTLSDFFGTTYSPNHVDSFGTGPSVYLYNGAFQDHSNNMAFQLHQLATLSQWTVHTPAIPEPSTYAMLAIGLLATGFVARRRKA